MLVAFDFDGTIELGNPPGPVKLTDLDKLVATAIHVAIVSPSADGKGLKYPVYIYDEGRDRERNLLRAKSYYPPGPYIYVSDNDGDDLVAAHAGFEFLKPAEFDVEKVISKGRFG